MAGTHGKSRLLEILAHAHEKGRAVAVYADADDFHAYEVGFVDYVDRAELVMRCLTAKGEPDGRRSIRVDDVLRVDSDNGYLRNLELLFQYRDALFERDFAPGPTGKADLAAQLRHAKERGAIVHLADANGYGPTGFVEEVGSDYVSLRRVASGGEPDGASTVLLSGIGKVHIGRRQEQVVEFFFRYHFALKNLLGEHEETP